MEVLVCTSMVWAVVPLFNSSFEHLLGLCYTDMV